MENQLTKLKIIVGLSQLMRRLAGTINWLLLILFHGPSLQ